MSDTQSLLTPSGSGQTPDPPSGDSQRLWLAVPALLAVGAILDVITIFLSQTSSSGAMSAAAGQWLPQAMAALALVVAMGMVARPRWRAAGASLAFAFSLAVAGINLATSVQDMDHAAAHSGIWILWIGWGCGMLAGVVGTRSANRNLGMVKTADRRLVAVTAVVTIVMGVALLPSWDRYTVVSLLQGIHSVHYTGSAFTSGQSAWITFGDVVAALSFALLPLLAVTKRTLSPVGQVGAWPFLAIGTVWVVAAQSVSAVSGLWSQTSGFLSEVHGATNAKRLGLQFYPTLTGWFDVEVLAALALLLILFWQWQTEHQVVT